MLDLTDWQNKKYKTRDGDSVRLLCVDGPGPWSVCGLAGLDLVRWTESGAYSSTRRLGDGLDLINAKTKKEGWANVYRNTGHGPDDWADEVVKTRVYASKDEADENAIASHRLACIKIEWEE